MEDTNGFGKQTLKHVFEKAREENHPFVFVELRTPAGREVIVIPRDSFDAKEEFYNNAYTEDLVHVMNKEVSVRGLSYGNSSELDHII